MAKHPLLPLYLLSHNYQFYICGVDVVLDGGEFPPRCCTAMSLLQLGWVSFSWDLELQVVVSTPPRARTHPPQSLVVTNAKSSHATIGQNQFADISFVKIAWKLPLVQKKLNFSLEIPEKIAKVLKKFCHHFSISAWLVGDVFWTIKQGGGFISKLVAFQYQFQFRLPPWLEAIMMLLPPLWIGSPWASRQNASIIAEILGFQSPLQWVNNSKSDAVIWFQYFPLFLLWKIWNRVIVILSPLTHSDSIAFPTRLQLNESLLSLLRWNGKTRPSEN